MGYTAEQVGAGLALLKSDWAKLSAETGISTNNLSRFRTGKSSLAAASMAKIESFFENNHICPTPNGGMDIVPKNEIEKYKGTHGFRAFMNDVYKTIKETGGEICVSNVDERNWIKWMGEEEYADHSVRMKSLENYKFKIFIEEGDDFFIASKIAEYRYMPSEFFTEQSFYAYGGKLALLKFTDETAEIVIHDNTEFAQSFRVLFNYAWSKTEKIK